MMKKIMNTLLLCLSLLVVAFGSAHAQVGVDADSTFAQQESQNSGAITPNNGSDADAEVDADYTPAN